MKLDLISVHHASCSTEEVDQVLFDLGFFAEVFNIDHHSRKLLNMALEQKIEPGGKKLYIEGWA